MAGIIEIYNMALANIGQGETVASLEERSVARLKCSLFYESCRDTVLADFPWPFATRYQALADLGSPPRNWLYRYQYPSDCLRALYLAVEGLRLPPEELQPPFEVAWAEAGQVLLTDQAEAELAYVVRIEEAVRFPPMFVDALAWRLASKIAMPMTVSANIAANAAAMYTAAIQNAWAGALNESKADQMPEPEYIRARY